MDFKRERIFLKKQPLKCLNDFVAFKICKMFYIVMLLLMCDLGDEQEKKGYGLIVMWFCVKQTRGQLCCLVLYQSDTARFIKEEGALNEKRPP